MPQHHGRKTDLHAIKQAAGVKHHNAIRLNDIADPRQRAVAIRLLATRQAVSVQTAVAAVELDSTVICETCRWTMARACPECNGCGCTTGGCHGTYEPVYYADSGHDDDPYYECEVCGFSGTGFHCCECGANHEYLCAC